MKGGRWVYLYKKMNGLTAKLESLWVSRVDTGVAPIMGIRDLLSDFCTSEQEGPNASLRGFPHNNIMAASFACMDVPIVLIGPPPHSF
jgi:hypothetical protein